MRSASASASELGFGLVCNPDGVGGSVNELEVFRRTRKRRVETRNGGDTGHGKEDTALTAAIALDTTLSVVMYDLSVSISEFWGYPKSQISIG